MAEGFLVPAHVAAAQADASDPLRSAWVSANAGSGKTHVLALRVIRLLLDGARPSSILCLTYTRAAAAEMSNRVFRRLSDWTRLDDERLAAEIAEIEGEAPKPATLHAARLLFARALETPGGLKIQTIHAFCEALLQRFPLEAGIDGRFEILDDQASATLLAETVRGLKTAAAMEEDATLARAFHDCLEAAGEHGLDGLLGDLIDRREAMRAFRDFAGPRGGTEAVLRLALGFSPDDTAETVLSGIWPLPGWDAARLAAFADTAGRQSAETPRKFAASLLSASRDHDGLTRAATLKTLFVTQAGVASSLKSAHTKGIVAVLPDAALWLSEAQAHVLATLDRLRCFRMMEATLAASHLAAWLDADYERQKRRAGRLDFSDLVSRARALLESEGAGAWVHYKLDRGIDHILVDEAQDTSPDQWSVIGSLAGEFFAGEGAVPRRRTLFAVGDEKQSIYSFQGARPERFAAERRRTASLATKAGLPFSQVPMRISFRSTRDVLSAVDTVFANPDNRRGLATDDPDFVHETARGDAPGLVEVWEPIGEEAVDDERDWLKPFDALPESAPPARLARRVAATIEAMIGKHTIADRQKGMRPVEPGDVIVLVRKRDAFVTALTRELKRRPDIPVAGADRLVLSDHIAVQDLMALGRAMLLAEDDLSLAAALKSPLFGLDEDQLFRLAAERGESESLAGHLVRLAAAGEAPFHLLAGEIERLRLRAAGSSPFEFYAGLLAGGGRKAFLARLGSEAGDVLDEFLSLALSHEANAGLPGLQGFLALLEAHSPVVKRELDKGRGEVRIMTAHAAKGLEAPVVFVVDPGGPAVNPQHVPKLRRLALDDRLGPAPEAMLWVPSKDFECAVTDALKAGIVAGAEEEYRRLLYVAMTRAADRLIVCGYHGKRVPQHPHWRQMVDAALADAPAGEAADFEAGGERWSGLRYRVSEARETTHGGTAPRPDVERARPPADLDRPLPLHRRLPRPLEPSGAAALIEDSAPGGRGPLFADAGTGSFPALERGRILHRFLEVLPAMERGEREAAALRYLQRHDPARPEEERRALVGSVLAILDEPDLAGLFSPESRSEVSIMGTLTLKDRDHAVSGRIDRLRVEADRVTILDYKTDRFAPPDETAIPETHRIQLALYRAMLRPLYPGRRIEGALLYTSAPRLIRLSDTLLETALETFLARAGR